MALIKKPYGLIYNTDGSLCYTERPDDTPFSGVTSWAIEEGTTNLCPSSLRHPNIWTTISYGWGQSGILNVSENEYYAFSADVKNAEEGARWVDIVCRDTNGNKTIPTIISGSGYINSNDEVFGKIESSKIRQNLVLKMPTDTVTVTFYWVSSTNGDTYQGRNFQVEQKPYATSFVDGTRANGKFRLPVSLGDNWVISFWEKVGEHTNRDSNILGLKGTSAVTGDDEILNYFYGWSSDNYIGTSYARTQNQLHGIYGYYDKWVFNVLCYDLSNYVLKRYAYIEDRVSEDTITFSGTSDADNAMKLESIHTIRIGECYSPQPSRLSNARFANFYIGHYRDKNGNVIWTDDFIRAVYEQKIILK